MVEQDFSRVNMDRYRSLQARAVGGPGGRRQRIQPFDPPAQLIFFDLSTQIKSTLPDTNFFGPSNFTFSEDHDSDAGTHDGIQLFLKAETPFNNIRVLSIPTEGIVATARFNTGGGFGSFLATQFLGFSLLRVNMAPGASPINPFGLDALTWNNSHATTNDFSGPTSLYATAANFERFPVSNGLGTLWGTSFGILSPTSSEVYQMNLTNKDGVTFMNFYFDPPTDITKADGGPFNGIHIFWNPVNKAGHPEATPGAGAIASLSAAVQRIAFGTVVEARAYIITDLFPVMQSK